MPITLLLCLFVRFVLVVAVAGVLVSASVPESLLFVLASAGCKNRQEFASFFDSTSRLPGEDSVSH